MTNEDIKNYTNAVLKSKMEHYSWQNSFLIRYIKYSQRSIREHLDFMKQKSRVKSIFKKEQKSLIVVRN